MTRGMLLLLLLLVVSACGAPAESLQLELPLQAERPAEADLGGEVVSAAAAAASEDEIADLFADQAASDLLAPRPEPPGERSGRGSLTRPDWLGERPLPLRSDGFGEVQATPFELIDRRFPPGFTLGAGGPTFESKVGAVPDNVLARSTWQESCPVGVGELAYVTVSYVGFDGATHIGELLVNASVADDVVEVFRVMFETGFPLEEVRVIAAQELDAAPTGDGNVTTAFVCRPVTGGASWSQHAYGLAIDINPFHNPYVKGDLVLPELASVYTDRTLGFPGMILEGDPVVQAFDTIGWGWGGRWTTLTDPQHFSANGR